MKNKLSKKAQYNFKLTFWIVIGVSVIAFGAMIALLRSSIEDIDQDPSLVNLTHDGVFRVVQIINTNKNLNEADCWNQKNPHTPCNDSNKITSGTYIIQGGEDAIWLEGPEENLFNKDLFKLEDDYIRDALGGFMDENQSYFQKIIISYPEGQDTIHVTVETQNSDQQDYSQFLTLSK